MVSLSTVIASNALILTTLPVGLVAIFVGGTSGIGEATLKKFAKHAQKPRVYIIGRSQEAADRILAECKEINPEGEFIFLKVDVSLIRNVDEVCEDLKKKETVINLLFLSQGVPLFDRRVTPENLHWLAALVFYSRLRFITNLLPLIQNASSLRRVVTVAGGTNEGPIDPTDIPGLQIPAENIRSQLSSLITLGLEKVAQTAPEVSFVHAYPGTVKTPLLKDMPAEVLKSMVFVPIDECAERHLFVATSGQFPAARGESGLAPLQSETAVAVGSNGKIGAGVYSVDQKGESGAETVLEILAGLRENGMVEKVWAHTQGEFERIKGTTTV